MGFHMWFEMQAMRLSLLYCIDAILNDYVLTASEELGRFSKPGYHEIYTRSDTDMTIPDTFSVLFERLSSDMQQLEASLQEQENEGCAWAFIGALLGLFQGS